MDLKARARKLREQADAATAEASARWDDFVQARTALEALEDGVDITAAPEFAAAQAAQETYDAAAEASRSAEREYRAVLELMGDDAPERPVTQVAQREAASPVSIGEQFTQSGVFREVSARIPETAGSKQAIGTTASVRVADREQARDIMRRPQATIFSTPDNVVAPDQAPGIRPLPLLPPLTVLDLITMATTDSTSVKWVREKAFTNAAAEVAETTAATDKANTTIKPESALQLEPVTFDVTTLAHWMPASKQSLRDVAGVRSLIDSKLEWGLRRRLATQIINGNGLGANLLGICNTPGIGHVDRSGVDAASLIEDIYDGVASISDAYGEAPNVCFVSRGDYKLLRFARGEEGGAGTGSFIFGPPTKANPIEVEDCLVLPNFDLPAGMSVMGVWREFAVWMHEGLSIALSDSHDDYFIKNLVAILAEFACAAGAMETVAFCEISAGSGS
jgi:hypothetical protein